MLRCIASTALSTQMLACARARSAGAKKNAGVRCITGVSMK